VEEETLKVEKMLLKEGKRGKERRRERRREAVTVI
jgi:hypothetical protein